MEKSVPNNGAPKPVEANIFELIDDNFIDKADLTLLPNEE